MIVKLYILEQNKIVNYKRVSFVELLLVFVTFKKISGIYDFNGTAFTKSLNATVARKYFT